MSVSPEKAIPLFKKSIEGYLEALWTMIGVHAMDPSDTLNWLDRPVMTLLRYIEGDLAEYFAVIEGLPAKKHDITLDAAKLLAGAFTRVYLPNDPALRNRLVGLFKRAAGKIDRFVRDSEDYPGLSYLKETMVRFSVALDVSEKRYQV